MTQPQPTSSSTVKTAPKYVLGISAFYHDSAAALVKDGVIVAAAQEERFTRIKHDPQFPARAIQFCLEEAGIVLTQCDAIVFYDKPLLKFERLIETFLAHVPLGLGGFIRALPIWLTEKLYFKQLLRRQCRSLIVNQHAYTHQLSMAAAKQALGKITLPTLGFSEHHLSHAASAFYPSPYDEAVVLCLDGVGEWTTSSAWYGKAGQLTPIWELHFPHSLGMLYSAFTYYCGFKVNAGEYKLMGLAPYGTPKYQALIETHLIDIKDDGSFALNMKYFDYPTGSRMINSQFCALFGQPAHAFDAPPTQFTQDMAASIQAVTERVVLKMAIHLQRTTQAKHLCLAGGVALNCVANGKLQQADLFDGIWVQPAAGDAGGALGAALEWTYNHLQQSREVMLPDAMRGAYLGSDYSTHQCEAACLQWHVNFTEVDPVATAVAALTQGKIVGWFQGKMEFGPRALGHRSILGDARDANMQRTMNLAIKERESFRPFAPIVMQEHATDWFDMDYDSPYMLFTADVKSEHRDTLPAVTHVDGSARVQTVVPEQSVYAVLAQFYAQTAVPVLINTSFNVRGEPPVCTPSDAIRCFLATDMDTLLIGTLCLHKSDMPQHAIDKAKETTFAKD